MDNTIVHEAFKRIDQLAQKLGTTAEYLWPKLVTWEYGQAMGRLALLILGWIIFFTLFYFSFKYKKQLSDDCILEWAITPLVILGVTLLIVTFFFGTATIATLVSPEAAAFYKIMNK